MKLAEIVERIISMLKKDPNYKITSDYSLHQLCVILFYRGIQVIRGYFLRFHLCKSSNLLFCGRNVCIEHGYQFSAGKSLILEDGVYINALSTNGIVLGDNVSIGKRGIIIGTAIVAKKGVGVKIGNNVGINSSCYIGGQGGVSIGDDVIIGPDVKIFSENHNYIADALIRKQGVTRKETKIEENCWVGAGVIILCGVIIHSGCVIAAGSVVTHDIPANSIAAGIPAKVIKPRLKATE
jgi:acetyltransferase-like isoleucine patch superfamily enzyme